MFLILTALSMTISTIVLAITGVFGGGGRGEYTKRRRGLEKIVRQVSRCTQKTCRKDR